ncbi:hypothetical protein IU500_29480 [Nocardia terpenica]|uniref:hypothetical protein n=1 Tax=Nocardia terpenica TaxID=455432 RepID=UPI0018940FB0|nr:hypothetical protein [Nocardia terpenica]MBF6065089.1 hypothetical protein [Nocardia terpenica]MBF6108146.1 hypothetical protein [Nocardia terpenica]MBF6115361.1 hypothetical protein [Nocardia terpenica]MBF6122683.1 hypothetical protein [Nocardia terpenica]
MSYPYGQPGYPPVPVPVPPRPGGGAAIAAGVLALLQGLGCGVASVAGAIATRHDWAGGYRRIEELAALAMFGTLTVFFVAGALLLFFRRSAGRVLVMVASVLVMLGYSGLMIVDTVIDGSSTSELLPLAVLLAIVFGVELLTLCLAASGSTSRWLAAGRHPAYRQPVYY